MCQYFRTITVLQLFRKQRGTQVYRVPKPYCIFYTHYRFFHQLLAQKALSHQYVDKQDKCHDRCYISLHGQSRLDRYKDVLCLFHDDLLLPFFLLLVKSDYICVLYEVVRTSSAACSTASSILVYPVQRQMFPPSACLNSSSVRSGFSSTSTFDAMIKPGVQKPH